MTNIILLRYFTYEKTSAPLSQEFAERKHPRVNARSGGRRCQTAIRYARVSTDEQAREGVSLEAQQARIGAYAQAKDLPLGDILVDEGRSGKDLKRPALQDLLARCGRGEVHSVSESLDTSD